MRGCARDIREAATERAEEACESCIDRWSLGLMFHHECSDRTTGVASFPSEIAHDYCAVATGQADTLEIEGEERAAEVETVMSSMPTTVAEEGSMGQGEGEDGGEGGGRH